MKTKWRKCEEFFDQPWSRTERFEKLNAKPTLSPLTVEDFFEEAGAKLVERGRDYDAPNGERSGSKVAAAFTALTGIRLGASEIYLILQLVKDARQWSCPKYHEDSAVDGIAFSVLKAEALASEA